MNLIVLSHKEIWLDSTSPSGYVTIGGFPYQMDALSRLFSQTTIIAALRSTPLPQGAKPLTGHNLAVRPLPEPTGADLRRKLALLTWLPRHLPSIWRAVRRADAVHTLVPGDIGTIGLLVALAQRKPLFVRHCGTWGEPVTFADRFLLGLLERIAGGRNVVLATGGGDLPPSRKNPHIQWIFSTALTEAELESLPVARPWQPGEPLRLVIAARLSVNKNIQAVLRALPLLSSRLQEDASSPAVPLVSLDVLGDGEARPRLERLAGDLGLEEWVTFHGNLSHAEVMRVLAQSHIFVFPTRVKEGFPKAVLEALAVGLPVVVTRVSVIPYLVEGCGALLADTGPRAVAEAIRQVITEPSRMGEMALIARQRARQYTLERWREAIRAHLMDAWDTAAVG